MLLVHQAGSVKVGEVVRYTLTYTPSQDRILPSPKHLHLKIKNTSAIPLRAAYLHGPYTLHVSAYPSTFNPNKKVEDPQRFGVPEFEPLLKAGGHWLSELTVPEEIRETGASFAQARRSQDVRHSLEGNHREKSEKSKTVTWIIEIASQILFSNSAVVHFEVLVGRDERSLELGFAAVAGHGHGAPGQVGDFNVRDAKAKGQHAHPQKGVYSKAVKLVVEDTEALWDKPTLPKKEKAQSGKGRDDKNEKDEKPTKRQKIHLVVLTHGLHSNIGADMLYLKESIDATVKQARLDARKRKAAYKAQQHGKDKDGQTPPVEQTSNDKTADNPDSSTAPLSGGQEELQDNNDEGSDDEEQTIVRGFTGNAVRTERGIQYLGKRLAKYILHFTYPDQPFLPVKKSVARSLTDTFKSQSTKDARDGLPAHNGSSIHRDDDHVSVKEDLAYTFTSISFVGHSLGGLIQMYAVAYIQKHAPHFFTQIEPVNFICMASPLLGLSNENPMYVKFALDFGLVGRTGQDLGLTWRAPTLAKSGWSNLVNGFGNNNNDKDKAREADPGAKPLLRILPTGPAHTVLRMFRNRTVYANVVNDGIVPLRTSCLLFLDWRGLGKVDKAQRENGLIGTMAEWGWAELTGTNALPKSANKFGDIGSSLGKETEDEESGSNTPTKRGQGRTIPQPAVNATGEDNTNSTTSARSSTEPESGQFLSKDDHATTNASGTSPSRQDKGNGSNGGIIDSFMSFLRPSSTKAQSNKVTKAIRRGQTMSASPSGSTSKSPAAKPDQEESADSNDDIPDRKLISRGSTDNPMMLHPHKPATGSPSSLKNKKKRPVASRGDTLEHDALAPPRTSIFESASDILHPPIPSTAWIIDPANRSRTIFHDRVYHPEDIPPPPTKRPGLGRSFSGLSITRSFSSDSATLKPSPSKDIFGANAAASTTTLGTEASRDSPSTGDVGSMRLEEKIARAYHSDLSWRKVLVRLEPDAHNNMIVRRQFANAYGWPVVKHLCDTHFADTWTARMRDEDEAAFDRAQGVKAPGERDSDGARDKDAEVHREEGEEVKNQADTNPPARSHSELREANDELGGLKEVGKGLSRHRVSKDPAAGQGSLRSMSSAIWDDVYFEGDSDEEDGAEVDTYGSRFQKMVGNWGMGAAAGQPASPTTPQQPQPQRKQTPAEKRLSQRTGSQGSVQPILSADQAAGFFSPSPTGSTHALSRDSALAKKSTEEREQPALVAEPEAMTEDEHVDPGNLTPATSGSGMVIEGQGSISGIGQGEHLNETAAAPEPEWKDVRPRSQEGKGFGEAELGLRKSVEATLGSAAGHGDGEEEGKGEMVARLSTGGRGE